MHNYVLHKDVHLGRLPFVQDNRDFKFAEVFDVEKAQALPPNYGFDHQYPVDGWGMYLNDKLGDCVCAGSIHESMGLTARGAGDATFSDDEALHLYETVGGYRPGQPSTDQGIEPRDMLNYRRKVGIVDTTGKAHKIGAYFSIDFSQGLGELFVALFYAETVGLGINFPNTAMNQFNQGQVWDVVAGAQDEGGHYIPGWSRQGAKTIKIVSWGDLHAGTDRFFETYLEEAWCYVTDDALKSGAVTARGFSESAIQQKLMELNSV